MKEKLLGPGYKFLTERVPDALTREQKQARQVFLGEIDSKGGYIQVDSCPYCGAKEFTKISEADGKGLPAEIVICDSCGGCFKSKILDPEANRFHYEKISYMLRGKYPSKQAIEKLFAQRVIEFGYPRYYFIRHIVDLKAGRDMIMELGCGDGANLLPWKDNGFQVAGIEFNSKMEEFGENNGLKILSGDFMDMDLGKMKPRLIILSHFLEHVSDINAVLKKIYGMLAPEGYLFIEVPGIRGQGLGKPLNSFDVEHNYYFDLKALSGVLEKHSFRIAYSDEYIRMVCGAGIGTSAKAPQTIPFSIKGLIAGIAKVLIKAADPGISFLEATLREGERNSLRIKVLNRLQAVYFKNYYDSMISGEKNGKR